MLLIIVTKTKDGYICKSKVTIPKKPGDYLYFIQVGEPRAGKRIVKIGTTNNIKRRMSQELRQYKQNITILWVSPAYTKYTTLRVEDKMKNVWKSYSDWRYIPNDRFEVPEDITGFTITVRRDWPIEI